MTTEGKRNFETIKQQKTDNMMRIAQAIWLQLPLLEANYYFYRGREKDCKKALEIGEQLLKRSTDTWRRTFHDSSVNPQIPLADSNTFLKTVESGDYLALLCAEYKANAMVVQKAYQVERGYENELVSKAIKDIDDLREILVNLGHLYC